MSLREDNIKILVICKKCGKEFSRDEKHAKRVINNFCSVKCSGSYLRLDPKDFLGKTFNNWEVLSISGVGKNNRSQFKCRCKCGKTKIVAASDLKKQPKENNSCMSCAKRKYKTFGQISSSFFIQVKNNAKKKDLVFEITQEDIWDKCIKQNHKCALSGLELTYKDGSGDHSNTASVNRIDSSKGYTKENFQMVHKEINYMKNNQSDINFIKMCVSVADHYNKNYNG